MRNSTLKYTKYMKYPTYFGNKLQTTKFVLCVANLETID